MSDWFTTWFNSPYYHVLYRHRDSVEAGRFIDNLLAFLQPKPHSRILDVACGRGRHSLYLCKKGHVVTGIDLSPVNIASASEVACNNLTFAVHDMREPFATQAFDYAFNFFTSFGYFNSDADNPQAVLAMATAVVPGGKVVIDFLNTDKVIAGLTPNETHTIDGIDFHIHREYADGFIRKHITFRDQGQDYRFTEQVKALRLDDFRRYFEAAGLALTELFGSYQLTPYDVNTSDRLIVIGQRMTD